jgi:glycosyltransferase involved in cell wall biosynthesis
MMLLKVVTALRAHSVEQRVVSLQGIGSLGEEFRKVGVPVDCLEVSSALQMPKAVLRLRRIMREHSPDIVQGWMYHACVAVSLAVLAVSARPNVAWNIRQTLYGLKTEKPTTKLVIKLGAGLSGRADRILYNSRLSAEQHAHAGYCVERALVVPNGFDLEQFRPSGDVREAKRRELDLPMDVPVIGIVARYHPMKDHRTALEAVSRLKQQWPDLRVLLVGRGVDAANTGLMHAVRELLLENTVLPLGERFDLPELFNALDVLMLSSAWGEGFPNVIGEAMATGVPCVATDIGECRDIIGATGYVVPPRDAQALASAVDALLREDAESRAQRAADARHRVAEHYAIDRIAEEYLRIYRDMV